MKLNQNFWVIGRYIWTVALVHILDRVFEIETVPSSVISWQMWAVTSDRHFIMHLKSKCNPGVLSVNDIWTVTPKYIQIGVFEFNTNV